MIPALNKFTLTLNAKPAIAHAYDDPARAPRAGLNFSSSELSLPLSVSGAALMVWSLFCFPPIQARLGARLCACSGLAATGVWPENPVCSPSVLCCMLQQVLLASLLFARAACLSCYDAGPATALSARCPSIDVPDDAPVRFPSAMAGWIDVYHSVVHSYRRSVLTGSLYSAG